MAIIRYPEKLDGSGSDYIKFDFFQYKAALVGGASNTIDSYSASLKSLSPSSEVDSIVITMPNDISSNIVGNWGSFSMTGLGRAGVGAAAEALAAGKGGQKTKDLANNFDITKLISGVAGGVIEDGLRYLSERLNTIPGLGGNFSANNILGLTSTYILNPNTELLYGGTQLRQHGYRFKMIAQSRKEAEDILKIADTFKQVTAPKGGNQKFLGLENRNFIGIPDICKVSFHLAGTTGEHPYLPKYKISAIKSVDVDYITEGQYMTFSDGHPIGINLTVELTELKLVFSEEIKSGAVR
jgi:hypothetical protein